MAGKGPNVVFDGHYKENTQQVYIWKCLYLHVYFLYLSCRQNACFIMQGLRQKVHTVKNNLESLIQNFNALTSFFFQSNR